MFDHFLVPLSGDGLTDAAVKKIVRFAKKSNADVTLVHVSDPLLTYAYTGIDGGYVISEEEYRKGLKLFAKELFKKSLQQFGTDLSINVRHIFNHSVFEGIVDAAKKSKADVIVMASHKREGIKKLFLGSETQAVIVHSKIPVLVI